MAIDYTTGTVTVTQPTGTSTYAYDKLSDAAKRNAGLVGIRDTLRQALHTGKSMDEAFDALAAGSVPEKRGRAAAGLPAWREAYANALAEQTAKTDGVAARKFGKPTPEFEAILALARASARVMSAADLNKAKTRSAVVAHFERITGADQQPL